MEEARAAWAGYAQGAQNPMMGSMPRWAQMLFPGMMPGAAPWGHAGPAQPQPPGREYNPLVAMKATGSRPPFFLVHGGFGSVFPYQKLPDHMGADQPLYGLQARGHEKGEAPFETVPEMAAEYVAAIRSRFPEGPYHLGGYSYGGWVAYEMAQLLRGEGCVVGTLALFGIGAPFAVVGGGVGEQITFGLQFLEDALNISKRASSMLPNGLPFSIKDLMPPMMKVFLAAQKAGARYVPQPSAEGADLFHTREQEPMLRWLGALGWEKLCQEPVRLHMIPGNHLSMFQEPHVQRLASELTTLLEQDLD